MFSTHETNETHAFTMSRLRKTVARMLGRAYPFVSGCGRFANTAFLRAVAGPPRHRVWAKVSGGRIFVPEDDYLGRAAYYVGDLDRKITWACRRLVSPGDIVVDIGANYGLVTVLLSSLVGPQGRVHAFEPNPYVNVLLEKSIGELGNVQLYPFGLGDQEARLSLSFSSAHAGRGSLVRDEGQENVVVSVSRLDDIVSARRITNISFIKIDVEGFEALVFRGAERTLRGLSKGTILFEANTPGVRFFDDPAVRILKEMGFGFYGLPRKLLRMRAVRIVNNSDANGVQDFVAVGANHDADEVENALRV